MLALVLITLSSASSWNELQESRRGRFVTLDGSGEDWDSERDEVIFSFKRPDYQLIPIPYHSQRGMLRSQVRRCKRTHDELVWIQFMKNNEFVPGMWSQYRELPGLTRILGLPQAKFDQLVTAAVSQLLNAKALFFNLNGTEHFSLSHPGHNRFPTNSISVETVHGRPEARITYANVWNNCCRSHAQSDPICADFVNAELDTNPDGCLAQVMLYQFGSLYPDGFGGDPAQRRDVVKSFQDAYSRSPSAIIELPYNSRRTHDEQRAIVDAMQSFVDEVNDKFGFYPEIAEHNAYFLDSQRHR